MENSKINKLKVLGLIVIVVGGTLFIANSTKLFKQPSATFVVEKGSISYEETAEAYIVRDEAIMQENSDREIVQIKYEGEKVAKGDAVFRYYLSDESNISQQIADLNVQINEALEEGTETVSSSDMLSLDSQIEDLLDTMYNTNEIRVMNEYINKIESYMSKKATLASELSEEGSTVRTLVEQRDALEEQLNANSEIIYSPSSGIVSYRVDGLESSLTVGDFSYLDKETLEGYDIKTGAVVAQTDDKVKIVNNFLCYIAICMDTEKASVAKVGDEVTLRILGEIEIDSEIVEIVEQDDGSRILVFEIKDEVETLIEYRKIEVDVIWWSYSGFKISNSAVYTDENDLSYIERSKAGYTEKIYVKVLRQNETYSIVNNYTDDELRELGFTEEEISEAKTLRYT